MSPFFSIYFSCRASCFWLNLPQRFPRQQIYFNAPLTSLFITGYNKDVDGDEGVPMMMMVMMKIMMMMVMVMAVERRWSQCSRCESFFSSGPCPPARISRCGPCGILGGRRAVNHCEGVGVIGRRFCTRFGWISLLAEFQGDWQRNNVGGPRRPRRRPDVKCMKLRVDGEMKCGEYFCLPETPSQNDGCDPERVVHLTAQTGLNMNAAVDWWAAGQWVWFNNQAPGFSFVVSTCYAGKEVIQSSDRWMINRNSVRWSQHL